MREADQGVSAHLPGRQIDRLNFPFQIGKITTGDPRGDGVGGQSMGNRHRGRIGREAGGGSRMAVPRAQVGFDRAVGAQSLFQTLPAAGDSGSEERPHQDLPAHRPNEQPVPAASQGLCVVRSQFGVQIAVGQHHAEPSMILDLHSEGAQQLSQGRRFDAKGAQLHRCFRQAPSGCSRVDVLLRPQGCFAGRQRILFLAQVTLLFQLTEHVVDLGRRRLLGNSERRSHRRPGRRPRARPIRRVLRAAGFAFRRTGRKHLPPARPEHEDGA